VSNGLLFFINLASLAVVVWAVVDVVRRPAISLGRRAKVMWIAGRIAGWYVFGIIGAAVAAFYLAGPRKRLKAGEYSGRY
jgi:hypothetical protein